MQGLKVMAMSALLSGLVWITMEKAGVIYGVVLLILLSIWLDR